MADRAEVVVVGGGVMGLAAARALARQERDVLVLEQFELGHLRGASHGATRIFRLAYPQPEWVRLAQDSLGLWRELEAESGAVLVELPGLLELVDDLRETSREGLDACGVAWEELGQAELERRYGIRLPAGWTALFQPEAGFIRAERALGALRASAERSGARIREGGRVESLAELDSEVVVVTAGAWAKTLLAEAGIELPVIVTRETVVYFELDWDEPPPSVVRMIHSGHGLYALADPVYGLKVGHHRAGRPIDDPAAAAEPDPEIVAAATDWARETFPLVSAEPAAAETCLYTNAPEDRFILERHGRIVVGSACSGHGFKFAPVVGRRLAELAR